MSFETVLASERIYEGRLVNLRVDQVRTPNGIETIREIIEHRGAVALVVIDEADHVILVKQYRHAVRAETIEVPAGVLEVGEDPFEAAQRELREETGYRADRIERFGGIYTAAGYNTEYIHFYLATGLSPDPLTPDDDEAIHLVRLPWAEAIDMIRSGQLDDGKTVAALLLTQSRMMR